MNGIQTLTTSYFDGATAGPRDTGDKGMPSTLFDDVLDTVAAHEDDVRAESSNDDYDDTDDSVRDDAEEETAADDETGERHQRRHADATVLQAPLDNVRLATGEMAERTGQRAATGLTFAQNDKPLRMRFDAPADMNEPGPRLTLDARVTQIRAGVTSRPGASILGGLVADGTVKLEALRAGAQDAASQKFAAGQNALEKLAARKTATGEEATVQNGEAGSRTRSGFAERMADLADRLAQRVPGPETSPRQARPIAVSLPTASNALQSAQPTARAGELPFMLTSVDAADDAAQMAAQAANRVMQSAPAAAQAAARAPQMPAGTPAEQVSVQIQHGLRNEGDRINLRLYPAALGKVEVKLELAPDKTVQAIVTAEKPETLDMLARDARVLQRALEDAGLQTNSNSLSFQQGGDSGNAGSFAENANRGPSSPLGGNVDGEAAGEPANEVAQQSRRAAHDGVLDVEI